MVVRLSRKEKVTGSIPVAAFYSVFHTQKKKRRRGKRRRGKRKERKEKKEKKIK